MANNPEIIKVANPAPLGLAGFGLTTVMLSCINAGIMPPEGLSAVIPMAFAFGGVAQIIAGVLEYSNGNTFGMVAFTAYGAFWWWFAFLMWTVGAGWIKPPAPVEVGLALALWGFFTLGMWVSTFRSSKAVWIGGESIILARPMSRRSCAPPCAETHAADVARPCLSFQKRAAQWDDLAAIRAIGDLSEPGVECRNSSEDADVAAPRRVH